MAPASGPLRGTAGQGGFIDNVIEAAAGRPSGRRQVSKGRNGEKLTSIVVYKKSDKKRDEFFIRVSGSP
jgi:hypothetical protein